jgi:type IV pilus assembly protein PilW
VVIGGAISLTLANRRSYQTNEGLSQVQEGARTPFELISRDLRQAGVTGCDNVGRVSNVLDTTSGTEWWMSWFGIQGFEDDDDSSAALFGTAARGDRVSGTQALQLQGVEGIPWALEAHNAGAATMDINAAATDIAVGDVMIICDFDHAAIFKVSAYNATDVRLTHDMASDVNCTRGLGFPTDCSSATGNSYPFPRNSQVGRFFASDWYVGQNLRPEEGGRSLFRRRLGPGGAVLTEEIVAGVTDLQFAYRLDGTGEFEDEAGTLSTADWREVNAIRVQMTVDSADTRVSTDLDENSGRISRTFSQVITLRNRVP